MAKKKWLNKISLISLIILVIITLVLLAAKFEKPSFREDSIDNPQIENRAPDTKPLLLEGSSDIEVLLVHGLGATTFETKKLAEYLNQRNITTYQVLVAGHGESIYDLEQSTSIQWYKSVEQAFNQMQKPNKFAIGSSLGSLLSIELSEKKEFNGVILFSIPLKFKDKRIKYTPFLKYFKRFYHRDIGEGQYQFYHENFPLKTLAEMVNYINKVKILIPKIKIPILIIQSKNDPRLDYGGVQYMYDNIASEKKELLELNSNEHVLIVSQSDENLEFKNERQKAFKKVYDFLIDNSD